MGHGQQGDAGTPWSIELEVTAEQGPRCGTIEYPTLRCGGHLAHCWRDADRISAVEEYTHDEGRCAPPGRLDLRCEENAMRWTWHGDDEVTTLLRRVR